MVKQRVIKVAALSVAILLCVPVAVNLDVFDQAIDDEVQAILELPTPSGGPDATYQAIVELSNTGSAGWEKHYTRCTSRTQQGCLKIVRDDLEDHPIMAGSELETLLARYREITAMTTYRGAADLSPDSKLPRWGLLLQLGGLNLANASIAGTAEFIDALNRDAKFWGMLFKDGQGILEKMVAVAGLWMNLQYVSEFVENGSPSILEVNSLETILARSKLDTADLLPAYMNEFRFLAGLVSEPLTQTKAQSLGISKWQASWFLQTNATLNSYYQEVIKPVATLSSLPGREAIPLFRAKNIESTGHMASGTESGGLVSVIFNPAGKKVTASAANISDYLARVYDLNGMLGLVQYQLARIDQPDVEINKFVDPAFLVDEGKGTTSFECCDRHSLCRIN